MLILLGQRTFTERGPFEMYRVFLWQLMETLLLIAAGLFAMWGGPAILGVPANNNYFWVGLMMALAFMFCYGLSVLGASRMSGKVQGVVGILLWAAAFVGYRGPLSLLPPVLGILLALLAGLRQSGGARLDAVLEILFAYSLPMVVARWLLVPMVASTPVAPDLVWLTGTFYTTLRVIWRIFWPLSVEGAENEPPLLHLPVPDEVAGLVESATGRRGRGYYTTPEGQRREDGMSVLVQPEEAETVAARVRAALGNRPFTVEIGQRVDGQVELVVRQREKTAAG